MRNIREKDLKDIKQSNYIFDIVINCIPTGWTVQNAA